MSTTTLTHWKDNFDYTYLGAYSINGQDLIGTIKQVKKEVVTSTSGKKQECTVCYFEELEKPMILNKTNCKIIAGVYKSPYIENWVGKKIALYKSKVNAFGEEVEALRIRSKIPDAEKPSLSDERLDAAIKKIEQGSYSVDALLNSFKLTETQLTKLNLIAV